jgi:hypothetical protein
MHGKDMPLTLSSASYCMLLCSAMLLGRLVPRDDDLPVAFIHAGMELHGGGGGNPRAARTRSRRHHRPRANRRRRRSTHHHHHRSLTG